MGCGSLGLGVNIYIKNYPALQRDNLEKVKGRFTLWFSRLGLIFKDWIGFSRFGLVFKDTDFSVPTDNTKKH